MVTEPAPLTPPPPADGDPVSDIGVKTFDEINATMAAITGVSPNQPAVKATFALVRQQLPAVVDLNAVLASHQVGIAQLAIEYCNALVEDDALRTSLLAAASTSARRRARPSTRARSGTRSSYPLLTRAMGTNRRPASRTHRPSRRNSTT